MSKSFLDTSFLYGSNALFIEELYQQYLNDPGSVSSEWQQFFASSPAGEFYPSWADKKPRIIQPEEKTAKAKEEAQAPTVNVTVLSNLELYRSYGHLLANLDPLGLEPKADAAKIGIPEISENDLLRQIYCHTIGAEISHVTDSIARNWLYDRFENLQTSQKFSKIEQQHILQDLVEVEGLEQYLHKKFPGAKRFSIEGGDASILALEYAIDAASNHGVGEVVIGMAHRGRLNTLTKVMGKPYRALLAEFLGKPSFPEDLGIAGDVKYHMGYSNDKITRSGHKVHMTLTPNPSHLEAVNPVVAGRVRAKQDLIGDLERTKVMGMLIHGDAAFCGQGIVAESLMMSSLAPYDIGGIIHMVINNQVGFTANPKDGHITSRYSTDFAKIIGAPIFHVNGDDIEAVVKVSILAAEYRAKFKKDVIIEVICYRKYGHNEGDEPMYTQPVMYNVIKDKKTPGAIYANFLVTAGIFAADDFEKRKEEFKNLLDSEYDLAKTYIPKAHFLEGIWSNYSRVETDHDKNLTTGIAKAKLQKIGKKLCSWPTDFAINPKLAKQLEARIEDLTNDHPIDWAAAEQLAFSSLLLEGTPIRITGQDAGRGTFSHRHSVMFDQNNGSKYLPLNHLSLEQAKYEVADSNLSEYGVLGFEFGYAMSNPKSLVIWEAQFGDFANGAQIMFDQFISACETKWLRLAGITILLPHSYEGQGPEHSSARLERFLQLAAEDNMQIIYPTTPASLFHMLRRQQLRQVRKPLIVMTPKSMLRNKLVVSKLDDLNEGTKFKPVIGEVEELDANKIRKVIICSGKVYYDLLSSRTAAKIKDVAIIRLEQLYPFPLSELKMELAKYKNAQLCWCQEEPANMGAWDYINSRYRELFTAGKKLTYYGRPEAASPATGYLNIHGQEQAKLVKDALEG